MRLKDICIENSENEYNTYINFREIVNKDFSLGSAIIKKPKDLNNFFNFMHQIVMQSIYRKDFKIYIDDFADVIKDFAKISYKKNYVCFLNIMPALGKANNYAQEILEEGKSLEQKAEEFAIKQVKSEIKKGLVSLDYSLSLTPSVIKSENFLINYNLDNYFEDKFNRICIDALKEVIDSEIEIER